jgi:hypothetical protein
LSHAAVRAGVIAVLAATLCGAPSLARANTADSDPKAVAIARRVLDALGGVARWNALPGLRWTFEVAVNDTVRSSRRHAWDKLHGWQRVEGTGRDGVRFVFATQIDGDGAAAWMDGQPIEGDSLQKLARRSRSLWRNDSYWFLMPYKLLDDGCRLQLATDTTVAGTRYRRLALSFEQVGDTPGDRYWVYVNAKTHRVERWDYVLQGQSPPAKAWTWEGWQQHGGLWFPTLHRQDRSEIRTHAVETLESFPAGTFTAP